MSSQRIVPEVCNVPVSKLPMPAVNLCCQVYCCIAMCMENAEIHRICKILLTRNFLNMYHENGFKNTEIDFNKIENVFKKRFCANSLLRIAHGSKPHTSCGKAFVAQPAANEEIN